jgi:Ribbon-helix-helix protein, copG family
MPSASGTPFLALSVLYTALYMPSKRTQVYLTAEQRRRLDERRRRERRPLAALIREALDVYLADRTADAGTALDSTFGALPDLKVPSRDEWDRA